MNIYLITDTHFNHKKVIEFCGRPENYEQLLYSSMNNVPEESILIHLGDICIGQDTDVHEKFIKPLKCQKWLVKGNHDRKSDSWYYEHGWDVVADTIVLSRFKKKIVLSHKPIVLTSFFNQQLRPINIHGHFHNTDHRLIEPEMDKILTNNHKLLAVEYTNYQVVELSKFINRT